MRSYLLKLPEKSHLTVVLSLTIIMAFVVAAMTRACFNTRLLQIDANLIIAIYQVMGTVYAILLAFAVTGVWQNFSKAVMAVQTEADALSDLVYMVETSADVASKSIREIAISYTNLVIKDEWPSLRAFTMEGAITQVLSREIAHDLSQVVRNIRPDGERENIIFSQSLSLLDSWLDARRTRILLARGNTAKALWPLLILGAFILFAFHGLFVTNTIMLWSLLLLGLASVVGLSFYLIFTLDCPFTGTPCVGAGPLEWITTWFQSDSCIVSINQRE